MKKKPLRAPVEVTANEKGKIEFNTYESKGCRPGASLALYTTSKIRFFDVQIPTLLDTGASVTVVNPNLWGVTSQQLAQLKARVTKKDLTITVASGAALQAMGWLKFHIELKGAKSMYISGLWVPGSRHACVVGMKTLQEMNFGMQLSNKGRKREIWFGKGEKITVSGTIGVSTMAHLHTNTPPAVPTQARCPVKKCKLRHEGAQERGATQQLAWCAQHHPPSAVQQGASSATTVTPTKSAASTLVHLGGGTAQGRTTVGKVVVSQASLVPALGNEYIKVNLQAAVWSQGEMFCFEPDPDFHRLLQLQQGKWQPQPGFDNYVRVFNSGEEVMGIAEGAVLGEWRRLSWTQTPGDTPWDGEMLALPHRPTLRCGDQEQQKKRTSDAITPERKRSAKGGKYQTPSPAKHQLCSPVCPPPPAPPLRVGLERRTEGEKESRARTVERVRNSKSERKERGRGSAEPTEGGAVEEEKEDEYQYAGRCGKSQTPRFKRKAEALRAVVTEGLESYLPLPVVVTDHNPYQVLAVDIDDDEGSVRGGEEAQRCCCGSRAKESEVAKCAEKASEAMRLLTESYNAIKAAQPQPEREAQSSLVTFNWGQAVAPATPTPVRATATTLNSVGTNLMTREERKSKAVADYYLRRAQEVLGKTQEALDKEKRVTERRDRKIKWWVARDRAGTRTQEVPGTGASAAVHTCDCRGDSECEVCGSGGLPYDKQCRQEEEAMRVEEISKRIEKEGRQGKVEVDEVERRVQNAMIGATEALSVHLATPVVLPPNSERAVLVTLAGLPEGANGTYVVEATTLPQWRARTWRMARGVVWWGER